MKVQEDNAPDTEIKKSPVSGSGLFAKRDFKKNEVILDYIPFIDSFYITEWKRLKSKQYNKNWLLPIDDQYCLTNDKTNKIHYMNHSREPNCDWNIKGLQITAKKRIKKGEELFIDYRKEVRPNRKEWPKWI
jgi:SET domain-containing protein